MRLSHAAMADIAAPEERAAGEFAHAAIAREITGPRPLAACRDTGGSGRAMTTNTLINLSLAILVGAAIGFERQWNQGMAGLRTNTLVAFGSACFVTIGWHFNSDRVAAQIVSGIGFLGAGVILHEGASVRGLNTAATLWCAAAVGALAGAGFRMEAGYGAVGVVALNIGLRYVQAEINRRAPHPVDIESHYAIEIACDSARQDEVRQQLSVGGSSNGLELRALHWEAVERDGAGPGAVLTAELTSHTRIDATVAELIAQIGRLPGVTLARWTVTPAGLAGSATVQPGLLRRVRHRRTVVAPQHEPLTGAE